MKELAIDSQEVIDIFFVPTGQDLLNQTLVDAHLEGVPGLGTLTVGSLTGGNLEGLGGKTDYNGS